MNVAMGDVDGDGILDLIVGAGKNHAPDVVAYSGASLRGKGTFGTELARFQPFDPAGRGGVSVAAAQIDGTNADNIIVASGPGIPSESEGLSNSPGGIVEREDLGFVFRDGGAGEGGKTHRRLP